MAYDPIRGRRYITGLTEEQEGFILRNMLKSVAIGYVIGLAMGIWVGYRLCELNNWDKFVEPGQLEKSIEINPLDKKSIEIIPDK